MRINYSIIFVSDMAKSVAFYRDVFGLPLKFETPEWTEFATAGATLALHKGDATAGGPPPAIAPGTARPDWSVSDLDAYHTALLAAGDECRQEPKDVFGTRIAQYVDPDGLVISVSDGE